MKNLVFIALLGISSSLFSVEMSMRGSDTDEKPKSFVPVGICTTDINRWGNPSICSCEHPLFETEDYKYNSRTGLCELKKK